MTSDQLFDESILAMRLAGREVGIAQASWIIDGNTSDESISELLRMLDDGDPAFPDPPAPLSGEWAGSPTIEELIDEHTEIEVDSLDPEDVSELAQAFEDGYYESWQFEVDRILNQYRPHVSD